MKQLEELVTHYLGMETDHAILITGKWGAGKTYHYETILKPKIESIKLYNDSTKEFIPITISLFGLKSIESIQNQIFLSILPYIIRKTWWQKILRHKTLKVSASVIKTLATPILKQFNLNTISDILSKAKETGGSSLNFNRLVICFDDFERKSANLETKDLIGFINTIVEKERGKVIVLVNEDKLSDDKDYKDFKEKVIGHTIEFISDMSKSYDSIVLQKFSGFRDYTSFLNDQKAHILKKFSLNSTNLRTLIFILQYFQYIYSLVSNNISENENKNIFKIKKTILEDMLNFTIAVGIEFKIGEITYLSNKDIDSKDAYRFSAVLNAINRSSENTSESYYPFFEKIIKKYYDNNISEYKYFASIYSYITGGIVINYSDLYKDIDTLYKIEINNINELALLYQKLERECLTLEDEKYKETIEKILINIDEGKYGLFDYPTILYRILQYGNLIGANVHDLKNRFIKGLQVGKSKFKHYIEHSYSHFPTDIPFYSELNEVLQETLKINEEIGNNYNLQKQRQIEDEFYSDTESFYRKSTEVNNEYSQTAIFKGFDRNRFFQWFKTTTNQNRNWLRLLLIKRYSISNGTFLTDYYEEVNFLSHIETLISNYIHSITLTGVSGYQINEIHKALLQAINNIHQYSHRSDGNNGNV